MYNLVLVLHVIVSLILIAVILFQAGKGGGLADTFGGGGGGGSQTTIFGQKTSDFLVKATEVSAVLFLCTSLSLAILSSKRKDSIMDNVKIAPAAKRSQAGYPEAVKKIEIDSKAEKEATANEATLPIK